MRRILLYVILGFWFTPICQAAELEGVTLPNRLTVGQTELRLNGVALRTYSFLMVPIYVAGLYLVHQERDAGRILQSTEMKLLDFHFIHDVSQESARAAWREGFDGNCSPCRLPSDAVRRFLAAVPGMRKGDRFSILFSSDGADITENGHPFAHIADRAFARLMLTTFIGRQPPTPRIEQELLGVGVESASRN